jgi:ubiquinone/menaquinone biosynthesis C-methylase UbiE
MSENLETVKQFWTTNLNGLKFLESFPENAEEFWTASDSRYKYHYHLPLLFDRIAKTHPGASLLEIGYGMEDDIAQWAKRNMKVTAINLTEPAIECTRKRLEICGLDAEVKIRKAEQLKFSDNTFDIVYSFGVLHHSPDTPKTIEEVQRVLKPGGFALIMLYIRKSLNFVIHRILKCHIDGSKEDPCPIEQTYLKKEIKEMFRGFSTCEISVDYLVWTGYGIVSSLIHASLHRMLGKTMGWHLMVEAVK